MASIATETVRPVALIGAKVGEPSGATVGEVGAWVGAPVHEQPEVGNGRTPESWNEEYWHTK